MDITVGKPIPFKENLKKLHNKWNFWLNSYRVDEDYINSKDALGNPTIKPFICESKRDYTDRKMRTTLRNLIGPIVQQYSSVVFRNEVERDEQWLEVAQNADSRGKTLNATLGEALEAAQIFGFGCLMVENLVPGTALSIAQARETGSLQRIINVDNYSLVNWLEVDGYLLEALISFRDSEGATFLRYYNDSIVQDIFVDKDNKKITGVGEAVEHGYSKIPVYFLRLPVAYEAFVQPLSMSQMGINNNLSLLSEEIVNNTFSRFVISGVSGFGQLTKEEREALEISWSSRRMLVLEDTGVNVSSISSDKSQADSIRQTILEETNELLRLAGLYEGNIGAGASGEARQISRDKFFIIASGFTKAVEDAENYLISLWQETVATSINNSNYSLNFDELDWQVEINQLRDILSLEVPEDIKERAVEQFRLIYFTNESSLK